MCKSAEADLQGFCRTYKTLSQLPDGRVARAMTLRTALEDILQLGAD
jgi:hypothetical protein